MTARPCYSHPQLCWLSWPFYYAVVIWLLSCSHAQVCWVWFIVLRCAGCDLLLCWGALSVTSAQKCWVWFIVLRCHWMKVDISCVSITESQMVQCHFLNHATLVIDWFQELHCWFAWSRTVLSHKQTKLVNVFCYHINLYFIYIILSLNMFYRFSYKWSIFRAVFTVLSFLMTANELCSRLWPFSIKWLI